MYVCACVHVCMCTCAKGDGRTSVHACTAFFTKAIESKDTAHAEGKHMHATFSAAPSSWAHSAGRARTRAHLLLCSPQLLGVLGGLLCPMLRQRQPHKLCRGTDGDRLSPAQNGLHAYAGEQVHARACARNQAATGRVHVPWGDARAQRSSRTGLEMGASTRRSKK